MKEMVELLLKSKADPNTITGRGDTLLHLAVGKRNPELLDILLAAGANPNVLDAQGLSALDYVKPSGSIPQPPGLRSIPTPGAVSFPNFPGQSPQQRREVSQSELADRLRKAGARDWAPRPGLITVTRRSTGVSQVIFTKGTNDWNRHSLLELITFTYFGSGTHFPFPDFSRLMITRRDPASGAVKEFTVDLTAKLAADGCRADEWLEWGDLVEIPEGVHKLGENWSGLPVTEAGSFEKCVARKVTLKAGAISKELELVAGNNWSFSQFNGMNRYQRSHLLRLRKVVLNSGLLLTSSDLSRTKVTRQDAAGGRREWAFDLTQSIPDEQDLWLRDGDVIEVPEKP
jgi:Ankyrin repeats (many copies)